MRTGDSTINEADILTVAKSIKVTLNEAEIKLIMEMYPEEEENDTTGTWDLITEHCIYAIIETREEKNKNL
jgi:hypothetical protein